MWFGIGIVHPAYECNVGGLLRSAHAFGAKFTFTVGRKYKRTAADTVNANRQVPHINYETVDDLIRYLPAGGEPICVEQVAGSKSLPMFKHPICATYILGNEGSGVPPRLLERWRTVEIPTRACLNVATAGAIVMYARETGEIR